MGLLDSILRILHQEKTTTRGEGHPSSFPASQAMRQESQQPLEEDGDEMMDEARLIELELDREIQAFYSVLVDTMGSDKLVLQAGKLDALELMRSPKRSRSSASCSKIRRSAPRRRTKRFPRRSQTSRNTSLT